MKIVWFLTFVHPKNSGSSGRGNTFYESVRRYFAKVLGVSEGPRGSLRKIGSGFCIWGVGGLK